MTRHILTTILLTMGVYLLLLSTNRLCSASHVPRVYIHSAHPPSRSFDVSFSDEGEGVEKRQFNDYGHMRFGKRSGGEDKFDDYGYMRFGRGV